MMLKSQKSNFIWLNWFNPYHRYNLLGQIGGPHWKWVDHAQVHAQGWLQSLASTTWTSWKTGAWEIQIEYKEFSSINGHSQKSRTSMWRLCKRKDAFLLFPWQFCMRHVSVSTDSFWPQGVCGTIIPQIQILHIIPWRQLLPLLDIPSEEEEWFQSGIQTVYRHGQNAIQRDHWWMDDWQWRRVRR